MTPFIPGLQLSELFYHEAVRPILKRSFPGLAYAATLLGPGSEVLGFDTSQSTDHLTLGQSTSSWTRPTFSPIARYAPSSKRFIPPEGDDLTAPAGTAVSCGACGS
jgi:hypothetical protein